MLHWNGQTWTKSGRAEPEPRHSLRGQRAARRHLQLDPQLLGRRAAGHHGSTGTKNEALHWNGKHWSLVSTPNPGGTTITTVNMLLGVRCTSASNCWAVGKQSTGGSVHQEILFWHGGKWKVF